MESNKWNFNFFNWEVELRKRFELKTTDSNTMTNYHLFQKLELRGKSELNHLIIILTNMNKMLNIIGRVMSSKFWEYLV